jgi:hypothetical protein
MVTPVNALPMRRKTQSLPVRSLDSIKAFPYGTTKPRYQGLS